MTIPGLVLLFVYGNSGSFHSQENTVHGSKANCGVLVVLGPE